MPTEQHAEPRSGPQPEPRHPPARKVSLFVTCVVDQALPEVGVSTVKLLRRAGYEVDFPPDQTCCGQPFFNSGLRHEARKLARRTIDIFADADAIVLPSGSCTSMIRTEYTHLFETEPLWQKAAQMLADKTFELSEFLVHRANWPVPAAGGAEQGQEASGETEETTLTYHDSCHMCRLLGLRKEPRQLLQQSGHTIVEMEESDRCCGFGGVFSVRMPEVSNAMTAEKLRLARQTGVRILVTSDPGCLTQMRGMLRRGEDLRVEHLATILEEASR